MPSPKYPLKPLLEHRERGVDDATAELGQAVRTREAAEDARMRAERVRREAEEHAALVKAAEEQRLSRGELRAVDLARADAWELGARSEIARLANVVETAEAKESRAYDAEEIARHGLAQKMADRDVVVKDAARFDARVKQRVMLAEEEAAEEVFRGGRRAEKEGG